MSGNTSSSSGCSIFCAWLTPERFLHEGLGEYYQENPVKARVIATPLAALIGIVKVILFPAFCVVGVVAMPIIALIKACRNEPNSSSWLSAWCFCVLGVAGSAAFIGMTAFYLPLIVTIGLLISAISVSITLHVYLLVSEPPTPQAEGIV